MRARNQPARGVPHHVTDRIQQGRLREPGPNHAANDQQTAETASDDLLMKLCGMGGHVQATQ